MKDKTKYRQSIVAVGGIVLGLLTLINMIQAPRAAARDSEDAPAGRCTVCNVAGAYGFSGSGTVLSNPLGLPEGPVATIGILTFDGQGHWRTMNQTLTVHGQMPLRVSLTGTYTVEADCAFTLVDDDTGNLDAGVFVHDRQEGFFMGVGEGVFLTFTMKWIDKQD